MTLRFSFDVQIRQNLLTSTVINGYAKKCG